MNDLTISAVRGQLEAELMGRTMGKIFQLSRTRIAVDFRPGGGRFLFICADPGSPRAYLVRRKLRELEKRSGTPLPFSLVLRKRLSGGVVTGVEKVEAERILKILFDVTDETGHTERLSLVIQLTGRSANLLLIDARGVIIDRLRETAGAGQETGTVYSPPARPALGTTDSGGPPPTGDVSEQLDAFYLGREEAARLRSLAESARTKNRRESAKLRTLAGRLRSDLDNHGDAELWKKYGDLILANIADAVAVEGKLLVVDYFDDRTPVIEIPIDPDLSPTENAEAFFKRYTKARNARREIARRLAEIDLRLAGLEAESERIEAAIADGDAGFLSDFAGTGRSEKREPKSAARPVNRGFVSSDGFEVLIGKGARENDQLTFKTARASDLWLHAADYPGSHVIVRNPNRAEIPNRTLIEAAKAAAFFSQGKSQPKAAVHYTLRKFVHKPKGAVPGLVSLSSFKTILVEPEKPGG